MNRKLTKSSTNVVISGSLAGIAEYIGIDPTIVRVIYVLLSLVTTGFPGFLLYIALLVLLPSGSSKRYEPYDQPYEHPYRKTTSKKSSRPRKEAEKVEVDSDDWSDF